uniref:Uncharacterized protein n=1 Tax=Setaria viridis TaxID=4556 RepID=A0A4U6TY96_SETVI|nr:hypothetical protein SEVIR_7G203250v2 [Setaria viridis]
MTPARSARVPGQQVARTLGADREMLMDVRPAPTG